MAGEKARYLRKKADDATTELMRAIQENGELRHLHGQPLDLSDASPDWFVHKLLKREGVAPPAIEQSKELDALQGDAEAMIERLGKRRAWLTDPQSRCTAEQAQAFNELRDRTMEEYRQALVALNRAIRDFNLRAPSPLHRRGYIVDKAVAEAERRVPPLVATSFAPSAASVPPTRSFWHRLRSRG